MPDITLKDKRLINQQITAKGFRIPETDYEMNILLGAFLKLTPEKQEESLKESGRLRGVYSIPKGVSVYPMPDYLKRKVTSGK